jgi:energy-coupling factor transporter ATP-binding protein EcfA2
VSSSRFNINLVEELTLGNFKCFSTTQSLPLRPITLLYGPNGAGKSSVIQALNWLPDLATGSWRQKFARFVRDYDQDSDLTFGGTISVAEETGPESEGDPFLLRMRAQVAKKVANFRFQSQLTGRNPLSTLADGDATFVQVGQLARGPFIARCILAINDIPFLESKMWFGEAGIRTTFLEQSSRLQVAKFNKEHPIVSLLVTLSKELALYRILQRKTVGDFTDPVMSYWETAVQTFDLGTITLDELPDIEDQIFFDADRLPIRAELNEVDRDTSYLSADTSDSTTINAPYLEMFPNFNWSDPANVEGYILDQFRISVVLLVNFLSDLDELTLGLSSPFSEVVHLGALRSIPAGEFLLTDPHERGRSAPDWHLVSGASGIRRQIEEVNAWLGSLNRRDTAYSFFISSIDSEESIEGKPPTKSPPTF